MAREGLKLVLVENLALCLFIALDWQRFNKFYSGLEMTACSGCWSVLSRPSSMQSLNVQCIGLVLEVSQPERPC